jgi:hypothetical protein
MIEGSRSAPLTYGSGSRRPLKKPDPDPQHWFRVSVNIPPLCFRVKDVTQHQLVAVAERYLVEPPLTGRTLIGPVQVGLEDRGWTVLRQ